MDEEGHANPSDRILVRVDADLAELIPGFLANRRKDIQVLSDAVQENDFETIRVLGHQMKGVGGGYGFDALSHMGAALEGAAKTRDGGKIRTHIRELALYLDRVEVVFEE